MQELQQIVAALNDPQTGPSVLATLVSVAGSSYRRPGARLLIRADGTRLGSISGGCLEEDVLARAAQVRRTGIPEAVVYDTTAENDLVWGVGLGCHGVVRVLLEPLPALPGWAVTLAANSRDRRASQLAVRHGGGAPASWGTQLADAATPLADDANVFLQEIAPPRRLVIFGAGDDAFPLARLGKEQGWHLTIADPRPAFASAARFPHADQLVVAPADQLVARANPDADSLAVVMTHHYVHDVPLLRDLLPRPLAYLGLLGPRKRAERILADIGVRHAPETLHAPIGLDLGADGAEQVAIAILAEIFATLNQRNARSLRHRAEPIHA